MFRLYISDAVEYKTNYPIELSFIYFASPTDEDKRLTIIALACTEVPIPWYRLHLFHSRLFLVIRLDVIIR